MDSSSITDHEGDFSFVVHKHYETVPVSPSKRQTCSPPSSPRRSMLVKKVARPFPHGVVAISRSDSVSSLDSEASFREASLKEKCSHLKIVF